MKGDRCNRELQEFFDFCGLMSISMMPTLKQIERLNQLLLDLYYMQIPPESIKFSRRDNKPFVIVVAEPIHDIQEARWYYINWLGELE